MAEDQPNVVPWQRLDPRRRFVDGRIVGSGIPRVADLVVFPPFPR
jgi:hypothetical protein